jgi:DNA-binding GntR family transcriptional regulator
MAALSVEGDREPLVDELAATLHSRILSGELPTGTRLRQEVLAAEFGVSRTPVREALRKLQASGVVEVHLHRGAVVHGPTVREIREAYQVRAELEGLAAELAATRIQDAQLRRLREAEEMFRHSIATLLQHREANATPTAEQVKEWGRANDLFHQAIQEAAGNDRLRTTIADLHRSFPRDLTRIALSESSRLLEENVEQHSAVLAAIERRDPENARRLMIEHVRRAGELITLRIEQRAGSSELK